MNVPNFFESLAYNFFATPRGDPIICNRGTALLILWLTKHINYPYYTILYYNLQYYTLLYYTVQYSIVWIQFICLVNQSVWHSPKVQYSKVYSIVQYPVLGIYNNFERYCTSGDYLRYFCFVTQNCNAKSVLTCPTPLTAPIHV